MGSEGERGRVAWGARANISERHGERGRARASGMGSEGEWHGERERAAWGGAAMSEGGVGKYCIGAVGLNTA